MFQLTCLVPQLEACLQPSKKRRSINQILAEAVQNLKNLTASQSSASKQCKPNENLAETAQTEIDRGLIMRDVLFSCRDVGIAIVDEALGILDCNLVFAAIMMGKELPEESAEHLSPLCLALRGTSMQRYIESADEYGCLLLALQHINRSSGGMPAY
jgi:hypothetical protein